MNIHPDDIMNAVEELKRDALRYRWLRKNEHLLSVYTKTESYNRPEVELESFALDDAIDTEMSA